MKYPIVPADVIIERIMSREYYINNMPFSISTNFALFYSERHNKIYRSSVNLDNVTLGGVYEVQLEDLEGYIDHCQRGRKFQEFHFSPFSELPEALHQLEDLVERAEAIIVQLKSDSSKSFILSLCDYHIFSMPMVDWYVVCNTGESSFNEFVMDDQRTRNEIITELQKRPDAAVGFALAGTAARRKQSTAEWIAKTFPYLMKPGVYYMHEDKEGFTYLANKQPIEISYSGLQGAKEIGMMVFNSWRKHRELLFTLLKDRLPVRVCLDEDPRDTDLYEFFNVEQLFTPKLLAQMLQKECFRIDKFESRHVYYSITDDCQNLQSNSTSVTYPLLEKLKELRKFGGVMRLSNIRRDLFPEGILQNPYIDPLQEFIKGRSAEDTCEDHINQHQESKESILTNIPKDKPEVISKYEISERWGMTVIKAIVDEGNLKEIEELVALALHEALTGVALKLSKNEGGVRTFGFGSRLLIAVAQEEDNVVKSTWDFQTLPEAMMLSLKTERSADSLSIEVNTFVGVETLNKITDCLNKILIR